MYVDAIFIDCNKAFWIKAHNNRIITTPKYYCFRTMYFDRLMSYSNDKWFYLSLFVDVMI